MHLQSRMEGNVKIVLKKVVFIVTAIITNNGTGKAKERVKLRGKGGQRTQAAENIGPKRIQKAETGNTAGRTPQKNYVTAQPRRAGYYGTSS